MEDETLSNILGILQGNGGSAENNGGNNSGGTSNTNPNMKSNPNNGGGANSNIGGMFGGGDNLNSSIQNILMKMFMSGGFNGLFGSKNKTQKEEPAEPPRTINLENYKRMD